MEKEIFRYSEVLKRGRPTHDDFDAFLIKHPRMPLEKRAKIFLPFDALKGFSEELALREQNNL